MPENKLTVAEAHRLIPEINAHYREFKKNRAEGLKNAISIGELLLQMKETLPHGEFTEAVEKRCEFTPEWGRLCMRVAGGQEVLAKIEQKPESITEAAKLIADNSPKSKRKSLPISPPSGNDSISEKGKPGGARASSTVPPASTGPASEEAADSSGEDERTDSTGQEAQETGSRPPRSGKDKPGTGVCPNCRGKRWKEDEFGFACSKCHHPWGEPADSQPEEKKDNADDLRAKAVKTMEAAMRVFDDLNALVPKAGLHKQVIELCKNLLKSAKSWK